mmetsp:Transcript_6790/g.8262  ORF Transcript_6790/g.8262 Transcript_6790/m.8262 type:complete len:85 (+) Transcript_6790:319-573(+)
MEYKKKEHENTTRNNKLGWNNPTASTTTTQEEHSTHTQKEKRIGTPLTCVWNHPISPARIITHHNFWILVSRIIHTYTHAHMYL